MKQVIIKVVAIITVDFDENLSDEVVANKAYEVIDEMNYNFTSTVDGSLITDTEIRDAIVI